ncbi:MAG: hypothetical protein A2Y33_12860 [Spirochaetes bacterium GWF1_51_8]|nr:MAG: hypothetical protein A2Y33_12860 [Spirochaetes bacterium GWF1_51_8]
MTRIAGSIVLSLIFAACATELKPDWFQTIRESEILLFQVVDLMYDLRLNPEGEYKTKAKDIYTKMQDLNLVYKKYVDTLSKEELAQFRTEYYAMEKRLNEYQVFKGFDAKIDIFKVIAKLAE